MDIGRIGAEPRKFLVSLTLIFVTLFPTSGIRARFERPEWFFGRKVEKVRILKVVQSEIGGHQTVEEAETKPEVETSSPEETGRAFTRRQHSDPAAHASHAPPRAEER